MLVKTNINSKFDFRNWIINGDNRVSQRADYTTATSVTNDEYFVDRWKIMLTTVSATIQRLITDQPSELPASYSSKLLCTSGGIGILGQKQIIEIYAYFINKTITLSSWVKSNNSNARIAFYNGTDYLMSNPHSGSGNWELLKVTGKFTSLSGSTVIVAIMSSSGGNVSIATNDYIEQKGVNLVYGKYKPFMPRTLHEESLLCYRYFYRLYCGQAAPLCEGYARTTNIAVCKVQLPVIMRTTAPTIYFDNLSNVCIAQVTGGSAPITSQPLSSTSYRILAGSAISFYINTSTTMQSYSPLMICGTNTTYTNLYLDAEL